MAFIYETYENESWTESDPLIVAPIGIENSGGIHVTILRVFIYNTISNYQELGNLENFCLALGLTDSGYGDLTGDDSNGGDVGLNPVSYNIQYPPHYAFHPGNITYQSGLLPQNKYNYKLQYEFWLNSGETFNFKLKFNPRRRKIDFYKGKLHVWYKFLGESTVRTIEHDLRADYISNISEVDGVPFDDICFSINGVTTNNILLVQ
tara:strand:+ start:2396 stop:3013 length:618 start_codon:yes stop_codon:yes gene_type:complete